MILTYGERIGSEEVNMEAYILCKNISSFEHNLLRISLYKTLKQNLFRKKKKKGAYFPELIVAKTLCELSS